MSHSAAPATRRRWPHAAGVGLVAAFAAALYGACSLSAYHTFRAGTYDLVIFDQAVRSYSRLRAPVSIAKGVHNGFGPGFSVLGDHFSPVLAPLAPLYRLHDGPVTLLVAQAVLFAAAVVPLWVLTRRELGTPAAYCVALGYALSWPVAQAVAADFHEVAFLAPLSAVLFERLSAYRRAGAPWWHVAAAAAALLTVKEDAGLLLAGLGLAMLVRPGRPGAARGDTTPAGARVLGAGLALAGPLACALTTRLVIPAFGGRADYYWRYGELGPTPVAALGHALTHPLGTLALAVQPPTKAHTLLWLLALGALAPLFSPYLLVVLFPLAERMLADEPNWWSTGHHYNAALVVPLLFAGVDGAARLARVGRGRAGPRRWAGPAWAAAVLAVALAAVPAFAFGSLAAPAARHRDAHAAAAAAAVARVPGGVLVEAANSAGPQLSARSRVLLWDREPRWAPWVVADVRVAQFPFCGVQEQRDRVALLERAGYGSVFERDGVIVLHRDGPDPPLPAVRAPGCGH